jgi:SAM-dependent methyltransferase
MNSEFKPRELGQHPEGHVVGTLAARWPEFVDCEERLRLEEPFLETLLGRFANPSILDAAMGIGCEVTWLTKAGYNVIGNEVEADLLLVARTRAKKSHVDISTISCDWRNLTDVFGDRCFDVVLLLGNSFCLLLDPSDRERAARHLYNICRSGGMLVIDERNFPYILGSKEGILKGHFRYSRRVVYCGSEIDARPIEIGQDKVRFGYFDGASIVGTLDMFPFPLGHLKEIFLRAGFGSVEVFSDFAHGYDPSADFYTYVFRRA